MLIYAHREIPEQGCSISPRVSMRTRMRPMTLLLARRVRTFAHMDTDRDDPITLEEHALADEILAEVARQRVTSKSVQQASGVKPRAWSNYLTTRNRHMPMKAVVDICAALKVPTSEMLRRAEVRAVALEQTADPTRDELLAGMSRRNREVARELSPEPKPAERPTPTRDFRSESS